MRAGGKDGTSLNHCLSEFLFGYRSSAHATTNVSPSELFLKRKLRIRFDLLKPDTKGVVESKQATQKEHHDKHSKLQSFPIGSPVVVRDFRHPNKWIPGVILRMLGPVTYHVRVENGKVVKRHIDHLAHRLAPATVIADSTSEDSTVRDNFHYPEIDPPIQAPLLNDHQPPGDRYPQRVRRPPERLMVVGEC